MMIHEITEKVGRYKARKRVGRGRGSGQGKTSGRGHKGAGSRSGYARVVQSEGGQMPYFRRIPKRGFTNAQFATQFWIANLGDILAHPSFSKGGEVNAEALVKAGLIRDTKRPLKVLAGLQDGQKVSVKLSVSAQRVSRKVRELVEGAGGSVSETGTRRDRVRGVERGGDETPSNLTVKLKRNRASAKKKAEMEEKSRNLGAKGTKNAKGQKESKDSKQKKG